MNKPMQPNENSPQLRWWHRPGAVEPYLKLAIAQNHFIGEGARENMAHS